MVLILRYKMKNKLDSMIEDETKAPGAYKKLIPHLMRGHDKKVVEGIIRQERMHKKKLLKIKAKGGYY